MRRWTINVVSLCLVALHVAAGQPIGSLIPNSVGRLLSAQPGDPPFARVEASPSLVVDAQSGWVQILAADGSVGWTRQVPSNAPAVSLARALVLALGPDSPDFSEQAPEFVMEGGTVRSASKRRLPAEYVDLGFPPEGNPYVLPWLEVSAGNRSGWTHPYRLYFQWQKVRRPYFSGLLRRPFIPKALVPTPPRPELPALTATSLNGPFRPSPAPRVDWGAPDAVIPGQFALYRSGRWTALWAGGIWRIVDGDAATVFRHARADIDRDGTPELILEFAQYYGDGSYSTLVVVKGRETFAFPLSGTGGEPGSVAVAGEWWVGGGRIWIARHNQQRLDVRYLREEAARVVSVRETSLFAALIGEFSSRQQARAAALAAGPGAAIWPVPSDRPAEWRWVAGRIYTAPSQAPRGTALREIPRSN